MANLRVVDVKVLDSTSIEARFSENLDNIITGQVSLSTQSLGVPVPEVLFVEVREDTLLITTQPLTPYNLYFLTFAKTDSHPFQSVNGSFLLEDGATNVILILGAEDPSDPIRPVLLSYLQNNDVYDPEPGTLIRDSINVQAKQLSRGLYDIRQTKNDNYLTYLVEDELLVRGAGPTDRLSEEGAYEVIRVGKNPTHTTLSGNLIFPEFPAGPISLQAQSANELLVAGTGAGTFSGLILTLSNKPIIKVSEVIIEYSSGDTLIYSIDQLGYQLNNARYDTEFASTYLLLEKNQIKLSDSLLESEDFLPIGADDQIRITYDYKSLGRIIDQESVQVNQILTSTREVAPPILTLFTLKFAPIVTSDGEQAVFAGVEFLDPQSNPPFSDTHPAFIKELPLKFESLPSQPGEFAIDYATGQVYVFGAETNDGTGSYPPVCTYLYRKTFSSRLDYTYDSDTYEVVASPLRDLAGLEANIIFNYQDTLVPGIDFVAQVHEEVLDERVENRLTSTNSFTVLHTPITNVFRIFNETSQEVYTIQRWNDNTVFFSSKTAPQVADVVRERVNFTDVSNEVLLTDLELINTSNVRIFRIPLANDKIINVSEDALGASFNSSITFSRIDLFGTELYFDAQTENLDSNLDRLEEGQYQVDYNNGIIYLAVGAGQSSDLGSVNYKKSSISTVNHHILAVSEIYQSLGVVAGINNIIPYTAITDTTVLPANFDLSDERFLNEDTSLPYLVSGQTITVSDDIKEVRGVYDHYNLTNFTNPVNFGIGATVSANIITLVPTNRISFSSVGVGSTVDVGAITPGAEIAEVISVRRLSDDEELYDSGGSFSGYIITLSGVNSPVFGDAVEVIYTLQLNGSATPIVDYNRGDYFIDYSYIVDEILVSYEHGDNCLDYRRSSALNIGENYYATYRVGALRSALLKNFGSLVNIPILNNFDTSLPRERYREALMGALQSFTKGPTIESMKLLVSTITHIDPEIIEAGFNHWSLGLSHLFPNAISLVGGPQLATGKFDQGVYFQQNGDGAVLPATDNLKLEDGTFETWVIPDWDGLDNDASLTFSSLKKNEEILSEGQIYIGSSSYHPEYNLSNEFTLNKSDEADPTGLPSAIYTQTGMFIFYDTDLKQWKLLVKEKISDGYTYTGTIVSSGEFYQCKMIPGLGEINDWIKTTPSKVSFELHIDGYDALSPDGYNDGYSVIDGYSPGDGYAAGYSFDGFSWMSDQPHYILDVGQELDRNRISLLKDGLGYLVFRIWDKGNIKLGTKNKREISHDVSGWAAGDPHHVAITWKLNSADHRDEMHLFVDGLEVPNILKYGGRPISAPYDRFRAVVPEILSGTVPLLTKEGNDLHTEVGSSSVYSNTINFQSLGVVAGHTIQILESGFTTYTILSVSGFQLTLDGTAPSTFDDARFSINPFSFITTTEIDLYENIAVSLISGGTETEIPGVRAELPAYSLGKNSFNQNILTLYDDAQAGDQVSIRSLGLNFRRARDKQYLWGNTNAVLKTQLPPPISLDEVKITAILLPMTVIGPNNAVFGLGVFTATGLITNQPTNSAEGRTLSVRLTSGNTDFAIPATVTIFGTTASGNLSETLTFTQAGTQSSIEKFKTISSITVVAKPVNSAKNSAAVEIKELYSITYPNGNNSYPIIRFSYQTQNNNGLSGTIGSTTVEDLTGFFLASMVGQILVISSPAGAIGNYIITARNSSTSVEVSPALPITFTNGIYTIYQTTIGRSGFQNGFFTLQEAGSVNTPYELPQGWYEFDYSVYLEIPFDPISKSQIFLGTSMEKTFSAQAILDEIRILNTSLTDTRVGEVLADHEDSITADYTKIRPFVKNPNTLVLIHADSLPLTNDSDYWVANTREYLQSSTSVNSNFDKSLVIQTNPLVVDNQGLLSTSKEGTIEFWVSPQFDTYNDPKFRFYFDASGSVVEKSTSISRGTVQTTGRVSSILSVRLATDIQNTGPDYFLGGSIESDFRTLKLGRALPNQNTQVKIDYIPAGLSGNRISIFKNREGYLVFNIRINDIDYQVAQPIFWPRDSWHRVMATYKFNRADNRDQIRLLIDGEERGSLYFGTGLIFGTGLVFGQGLSGTDSSTLTADMNFSDPINKFYIGSDYLGVNSARARIDNLRLSNSARAPLLVAGQPKDTNYISNTNLAYPVVEDLFTTYLLNFDKLIYKNLDFALLRNETFGIFNFDLNIIDSFKIVSENPKVKQILETLIGILKPAQSKVNISYF